MTIIQRAGGALNLNPHFHCLVLDGVYSRPDPRRPPLFHATAAPTDEDIADILLTVRVKTRRLLQRRGLAPGEPDVEIVDPLAEEAPLLAACYGASVQGTVALGPRAGHSVSRLPSHPPSPVITTSRCAHLDGYSLHADVRVAGSDRKRLEHLCRYVARPPLAQQRLTELPDGRVLYTLSHPWSDGTQALSFEPLELLERLCVLVPRPDVHLTRFHGVLAPHAAWRSEIVPGPPVPDPAKADPPSARAPGASRHALPWATLLARVFAVDVLTCPKCGAPRRLIAVITDPRVIRSILERLGLPPEPPPREPARAPPQGPLDFAGTM